MKVFQKQTVGLINTVIFMQQHTEHNLKFLFLRLYFLTQLFMFCSDDSTGEFHEHQRRADRTVSHRNNSILSSGPEPKESMTLDSTALKYKRRLTLEIQILKISDELKGLKLQYQLGMYHMFTLRSPCLLISFSFTAVLLDSDSKH